MYNFLDILDVLILLEDRQPRMSTTFLTVTVPWINLSFCDGLNYYC